MIYTFDYIQLEFSWDVGILSSSEFEVASDGVQTVYSRTRLVNGTRKDFSRLLLF